MRDDPADPATGWGKGIPYPPSPFINEDFLMPAVNTKQIQELRRRTGAGMLHCKSTLEATKGDLDQAVERLRLEGVTKAETRSTRRTSEGVIASYIHHNGKLAALVEVNCETDFVARTTDFANLAQQLAEHIAAAAPIAVSRDALAPDVIEAKRLAFENEVRATGKPEPLVAKIVAGKIEAYLGDVILVDQKWVREPKVKVADLIHEVGAKTGENIQVRRFARFHMGIA